MDTELQVVTKEPKLAAAASAIIIITWIPQFYEDDARDEGKIAVDEEHLAAASAMTQNLLLLLKEQNIGTYWGSGGILRKPIMFDYLGIPQNEKLLGAIHLQYPELINDKQACSEGKHRHSRSNQWINEITELPAN